MTRPSKVKPAQKIQQIPMKPAAGSTHYRRTMRETKKRRNPAATHLTFTDVENSAAPVLLLWRGDEFELVFREAGKQYPSALPQDDQANAPQPGPSQARHAVRASGAQFGSDSAQRRDAQAAAGHQRGARSHVHRSRQLFRADRRKKCRHRSRTLRAGCSC